MDQIVSPSGGGGGGDSGGEASSQAQQQAEAQEQRERQQEEFKNQVLNQILDQQARARLSTLSLAKPDKANAVISLLINMARMGRLGAGSKINEAQLIDILEKVGSGSNNPMSMMMGGGGGGKSSNVNFTRRALDDDDDDYAKIMEDL